MEYIGSSIIFIFSEERAVYTVYVNDSGFLVTKEPDGAGGTFDDWFEFQNAYPFFAEVVNSVMQQKIQNTINSVQEYLTKQPQDNGADPMYS